MKYPKLVIIIKRKKRNSLKFFFPEKYKIITNILPTLN